MFIDYESENIKSLSHIQAPLSMGILQARILEWVAIPFSGGYSWPRDQTQVSCTAGRFFTIWAMVYANKKEKKVFKKGNDTNELTYKTERLNDIENDLMVAGGRDGVKG